MDKKKIFVVIGIAAVIGGCYFAYRHIFYVETDNAQVSAHVLMLSSRVNGTIQKVMVDETNYKRATELIRSQAIPRERYDAAQAGYKDSVAKLHQAKAQLEQANLNVSYTKIVAPSDGIVARKSVEPGQFVSTGQPMFGFVDAGSRWVTANLKETEIEDVKPGRKVDVEVDAVSGRSFHGEVESIGPSTGAMFSLLPPDNSTGNFTKVVQRVPVRIRLLNLAADDIDRLQAGLSAVVSIRVK
jgi:membrane fusion protein (multidrug efflux system)